MPMRVYEQLSDAYFHIVADVLIAIEKETIFK